VLISQPPPPPPPQVAVIEGLLRRHQEEAAEETAEGVGEALRTLAPSAVPVILQEDTAGYRFHRSGASGSNLGHTLGSGMATLRYLEIGRAAAQRETQRETCVERPPGLVVIGAVCLGFVLLDDTDALCVATTGAAPPYLVAASQDAHLRE
jgi:hypothetical protein